MVGEVGRFGQDERGSCPKLCLSSALWRRAIHWLFHQCPVHPVQRIRTTVWRRNGCLHGTERHRRDVRRRNGRRRWWDGRRGWNVRRRNEWWRGGGGGGGGGR